MKKTLRVLALVLVLAMSFLMMVSCSTYPKVKKAFENEGFTENTEVEELNATLLTALGLEESAVVFHIMVNPGPGGSLAASLLRKVALIIEFNATKEMVEYYQNNQSVRTYVSGITENENVKAVYNSLCDEGYASGSCLVIPLTLITAESIKDIVKDI